jgi:DNA-binding NtrC family response regulator
MSPGNSPRGGSGELDGCFRRALIVEDNPIILSYITAAFASWGTQVDQACSVEAGITLLVPPLDLIIADVCLPDGTTSALFELALRLQPRPLAIAISGRASAAEAFELAKVGVHSFLAKPFSKPQLVRCIRHALEQRHLTG